MKDLKVALVMMTIGFFAMTALVLIEQAKGCFR